MSVNHKGRGKAPPCHHRTNRRVKDMQVMFLQAKIGMLRTEMPRTIERATSVQSCTLPFQHCASQHLALSQVEIETMSGQIQPAAKETITVSKSCRQRFQHQACHIHHPPKHRFQSPLEEPPCHLSCKPPSLNPDLTKGLTATTEATAVSPWRIL